MTVQQAKEVWGDRAEFRGGGRQTGKTTQAMKDADALDGRAILFTPFYNQVGILKNHFVGRLGHTPRFPIRWMNENLHGLRARQDEAWFFDEYTHMDDKHLEEALDLAAIYGVQRLVFIG